MKINLKLSLFTFLILFIGGGFWACDDDDSDIDELVQNLSIEFPMEEGADYHAMIFSTKTTNDGAVQYSTIKEYESAEPVLVGKLTSIILKSSISESDTISLDFLEMDKQTGVLKVLDNKSIKAGMYSLDIQINTIKQSEIKDGSFKLKVVETSLTYPLVNMFQAKAMQSAIAEITGGIVADTYILKNSPEGITINSETGVISAEEGNNIELGEYVLDVEIICSEGTITYQNAITIKVEKEIIQPADLIYENKAMVVGEALSITPTVVGNELVFALADGTSDEFSIDVATGELSLVADNNLAIGEYDIVASATNSKGSTEGTFHLVVTAPLPANLVYDPSSIDLKTGDALISATPSLDNSENVTFKISGSEFFIINANTGVISAEEGNTIPEGTYNLDVTVTYQGGEVLFNSVYEVSVTDGVIAPSELAYSDEEIFAGDALTSTPKTIAGTELTFELVSGSPTQISVDASNGQIKLVEGNDLAVGEYTIKVKVSNSKGSTEGTLSLIVKEKVVGTAPSNLVFSTSDTIVATRSNYKSVIPSIENGDGVAYSISDDANFTISTAGVISFKEGVHVPGDIYSLTVTATNDLGNTTADYKITVMELRYDSNPLTGTIADGISSVNPQTINFTFGSGTYELKGVYFTGTLNGKVYNDVLLEGGADSYTNSADLQEISDALGWTKNGKVDLNKPRLELFNQAKGGIWDGSINSNPGSTLLQAGTYSLKIRFTDADGKIVNFEHAVDITLN